MVAMRATVAAALDGPLSEPTTRTCKIRPFERRQADTITEKRAAVPGGAAIGERARVHHAIIYHREHRMLNTKLLTWSLGVFAAISFVVCVVYGLLVPESLHNTQFLEAVLPAFKWLTVGGFLLGLVESFLYGAYIGLVFAPVYNFFHRRFGVLTR